MHVHSYTHSQARRYPNAHTLPHSHKPIHSCLQGMTYLTFVVCTPGCFTFVRSFRRNVITIEQYHFATDTWSVLTSLRTGGTSGIASAIYHDYLFVAGGYNKGDTNPVLADVDCFDMALLGWVEHHVFIWYLLPAFKGRVELYIYWRHSVLRGCVANSSLAFLRDSDFLELMELCLFCMFRSAAHCLLTQKL